ncbi:MAG: VF530 family protein [Sediminibacterium sp.]
MTLVIFIDPCLSLLSVSTLVLTQMEESYICYNQSSIPMEARSNDPLHGVTLEKVVTELVAYFGWEDLGQHIPINCFISDPSIKSSLKFLRKTPWARKKVEDLYIRMVEK